MPTSATDAQHPGKEAEQKQLQDIRTIGIIVAILIVAGISVVAWQSTEHAATAILWSFASLLAGLLFGFLFGIPRVLQGNQPSEPPTPAPPAENAPESEQKTQTLYRLQVNTNLEQISDWLTKIIV
ncbi:MAG: hypothetical protein EOM24_18450, partial [Chloroflexia bacterium]|nr:hypothetical protein [Chloroflexia bacterium]